MSEKIPMPKPELSQEELIRIAELTKEEIGERLLMRNEIFPFAGINEATYQKLKSESDEFPGYSTHIDELIKRFDSEGFKIVITGGVNVFAMPALCDSTSAKDIEENTVFLKYFKITNDTDEDLNALISALVILGQK
jgi:hypothetical protein